ncbi:hypothetical protein TARUN_8020 [Trichoderma arundinaceum]|uniref:Uncharacterized protein n=1 Tax=Trichoderma arundinaceum TaxID=490622 RepID=A0A395NDY7_TRIAR|nr:hypothetical protein TARUN_8020 [Trichoderma arundinaceum]
MGELKYTYEDYTIGWVSALPNEQAAALFMLDERHEDLPNPTNDPNAYTLGSIGKHKVVIAGLPKGRVGLMVGIGGGIPQKTRLGDVVISCPSGSEPGVIQWDMGKAEHDGEFRRTGSLAPPPTALLTALGKFEADQIISRNKMLSYLKCLGNIPNVPKSFLKSNSLKDNLYEPQYRHVQGEDCSHCDQRMLVQREPREGDTMIHCGLIVSGNQVVKDAILRDNLYKRFDESVLCIEMEAAGLMNDFPCVVIRGICDYADSHKNKKWQNYAASVAAACAKAFLTVVPTNEVDKLQRLQVSITPEVIQGGKKIMAYLRGDKKTVPGLTPTRLSPGELDDISKDEMPQEPESQASASGTVKSRDTTSHIKSMDRASDSKPGEISPNANPPLQPLVESWLREASSSLAKMVQEGHIDAAMRKIIMNLSQLMISREGINSPQGADWNNNPQTPPLSPRRGSYTSGGDNGYGYNGHDLVSRSSSFAQSQPGLNLNYRNVSTQTDKFPARSQTFPIDPGSNTPTVYLTQHSAESQYSSSYDTDDFTEARDNYGPRSPPQSPKSRDISDQGNNSYRYIVEPQDNVRIKTIAQKLDTRIDDYDFTYEDDLPMDLGESQRRPFFSGPSVNMDANSIPHGTNGSQGQRCVTNWNSENLNLIQTCSDPSQAFFAAVETGDIATIETLLDNGVDLEIIDGSGRTPFWCAVQIGRRDVIQALLDRGADTEAQNAYGQTILAWAVEMHRNEIIDMLGYS